MINSGTDTLSNYYTPTDPALKAWNGRRIVLGFLGFLGFFFLVIVGGFWFYGQVEAAQQATDRAWRGVAEQLSMRYHRLEKLVALGVDQGFVAIELGEQFRLNIDTFSSSLAVGNQMESAIKLEQVLTQMDKGIPADFRGTWTEARSATDGLAKAVDQYNTDVREQNSIRNGLMGRVLQIFIRLNEPTPFALSSVNP